MAQKSTILTEPSDLDTTTYDSTYDITEVPGFNALLAASLRKFGDNQLARYLTYDARNIINELLKRHIFGITLAILH